MPGLASVLVLCACVVATASCTTSSVPEIREVLARAAELDGKRVTTSGLVFVNDRSLNLVSQRKLEGQMCVGLLIRADRLDALRPNDQKWRQVTGTLVAEGCGGNNICHNSCGPVAIRDPEFAAR